MGEKILRVRSSQKTFSGLSVDALSLLGKRGKQNWKDRQGR